MSLPKNFSVKLCIRCNQEATHHYNPLVKRFKCMSCSYLSYQNGGRHHVYTK